MKEMLHSGMMNRKAHTQGLFGIPTGYVLLAVSSKCKFLLGHISITSHVSCTPVESRKSNCNYVDNYHSNSTVYMLVPSLKPRDS